MLREWIRNISLAEVDNIVADQKVRGTYIWCLACAELQRRCGLAAA